MSLNINPDRRKKNIPTIKNKKLINPISKLLENALLEADLLSQIMVFFFQMTFPGQPFILNILSGTRPIDSGT